MEKGFAFHEPLIVLVICGIIGSLLVYFIEVDSLAIKALLFLSPIIVLMAIFIFGALALKIKNKS